MDWLLDDDGDLVVDSDLQFVTGVLAVKQDIQIRLKTFLGEWFLDETEGVDYLGIILGQPYDPTRIHAEIRRVILPVVDSVTVTSTFDSATRQLDINWIALTTEGELIEDSLSLEL